MHHSVPFKQLYAGILRNDETAKTQGVEVVVGGDSLRIINIYVPPATSCPLGYAPDFDSLLEDRGDQLVMGYFNAHHPSWYSRTEDEKQRKEGKRWTRLS